MIRRKLAMQNPAAYEPDMAGTLYNLALLYKARGDLKQTERRASEAEQIIIPVAEQTPPSMGQHPLGTRFGVPILR